MSEIHDERVRELAKVRLANDMTFHRGVGEASGNTFMMKLWPVLEAEMTPVLAVEHEQRHDYSRAYALHESLVECIRCGDRDEIMRTYACTWWVVRKNPWKPSTPNPP